MTKRIISAVIAAVLLTACGSADKNPPETTEHVIEYIGGTASQISKDTVSATADFGVELFRQAYTARENCLISPLSVTFALAMTELGAADETLRQMETVLGGGMTRDVFTGELISLKKDYDRLSTLRIANGIWYKEGLIIPYDSFSRICEEDFGAPLTAAALDASTVKEINGWVKEHTKGRIEKIVDNLSPNAAMCLVNALSFDGKWEDPCDEHSVTNMRFTNAGGSVTEVDAMNFSEHSYITCGDGEGFLKPYTDGRFAFAALLPPEGVELSDYIATLTGEDIVGAVTSAKRAPIEVVLPKFKADFGTELNEHLKAMGMTDAFDELRASFSDFGQITEPDTRLFIARVIHKTCISVDEAGTEAAAATAVILDKTMGMDIVEGEVKRIVLDRPFVYMIVDTATGLPLFMGAMENMG